MGAHIARHFKLLSSSIVVSILAFVATAEDFPVAPRILQPVDEAQLAVLKGNTHRLARAQFDRGVAPPDLPMQRMLLVLKRSPEQQAALRKLLDDQQEDVVEAAAKAVHHRHLLLPRRPAAIQ